MTARPQLRDGRLSHLRLIYVAPSPLEQRRRRVQLGAWTLLGCLTCAGALVVFEVIAMLTTGGGR